MRQQDLVLVVIGGSGSQHSERMEGDSSHTKTQTSTFIGCAFGAVLPSILGSAR